MHRNTVYFTDVTHFFLFSYIYPKILESFIIFNIATAFQIAYKLNKYRYILLHLYTMSSLDHYLRKVCLITRLVFISVPWLVMTMCCF